MALKRLEYNPKKVDMIHQSIVAATGSHQPLQYEILVDDIKVVQRTSDPQHFDKHTNFVDAGTGSIEIRLYYGDSNNCDKHIFILNGGVGDGALSGTGIKEQIEEKLATERMKWDLEQLQKEVSAKKDQLKRADDYIQHLEKQVAELQNGPKISGATEFGSILLEAVIRRNPQWLEQLPFGAGESLAGMIAEDNKRLAAEGKMPEDMTEASFKKKEGEVSEEDRAYIDFLKGLQQTFSREELAKIMTILEYLSRNPDQIGVVLELLTEKNEAS